MAEEERELTVFSPELLPGIFTLRNSSAYCYLNSLVQSLLSCSSFNLLLQSSAKGTTARELQALLGRNSKAPSVGVRDPLVDSVASVLLALRTWRQGRKETLELGRQEDIHEGLVMLLDALPSELVRLFYVRYHCKLYCTSCEKEGSPLQLPSEPVVDLTEKEARDQTPLTTQRAVEDYIQMSIFVPRDYKCENCGVSNTKGEEKIRQMYVLRRIGEVIVLLYKKYLGKEERYFPPELCFRARRGCLLRYRVVAQVEHYGGQWGGHYVCRALRRKPSDLHQKQKLLLEKKIQREKLLMKRTGSPALRALYQKEISSLEEDLEEVSKKEDRDSELGVFLFNDTQASYCPEGFLPTPHTYMVFYHLWEKN